MDFGADTLDRGPDAVHTGSYSFTPKRYPRMIGTIMFVFAVLCVPLFLGRIGPNPIFGYVTSFARKSPSNWYHMNRFASCLFIPFFGSLAIAEVFLDDKALVWILLIGAPLLFGICLLEEWRQKFKQKRLEKKQNKAKTKTQKQKQKQKQA